LFTYPIPYPRAGGLVTRNHYQVVLASFFFFLLVILRQRTCVFQLKTLSYLRIADTDSYYLGLLSSLPTACG